MAHSVKYNREYAWAGPVQIRGYDANLALLRWFFQHSQVAGGWIKFDYLAKSDGELTALKAAVPDLGNPVRDLNSFRTILYHLSSHQRFTDEQVVQIGTLIVGWSPQAMDVLKSYSPAEPPDSKGYTLLCKWAGVAEATLKFFMRKIAHSCGIIDTYLRFRAEVDKLQPLMNEMTIGRSNKLSWTLRHSARSRLLPTLPLNPHGLMTPLSRCSCVHSFLGP